MILALGGDNMAISEKDSILNSVKKMLGIEPDVTDFNTDLIININSAILALTQNGVGPSSGYHITDEKDTYEDFLGEDKKEIYDPVGMYLFVNTKMRFDPPASSIVMEALKETKKELEWRLNVFEEVKENV